MKVPQGLYKISFLTKILKYVLDPFKPYRLLLAQECRKHVGICVHVSCVCTVVRFKMIRWFYSFEVSAAVVTPLLLCHCYIWPPSKGYNLEKIDDIFEARPCDC